MGTWGTAIFSDDTASDVRGDFRDLVGDGLSPEEATDRLLAKWASSIDDPDDGPPFWLGLAVTQWKCGRLQERVKSRALEIIDSRADLLRWGEDAKAKKARESVLAKTRALLMSPQPAAKRIPKRFRESNDWAVGERISYRMVSGKYVVFRVLGHSIDKGGKRPVVDLLDYYSETEPNSDQARILLPRRTISKHECNYSVDPPFMIGAMSEREIPKQRLRRLGVYDSPPPPMGSTQVLLWRWVDSFLGERMAQLTTWRPGPGGDEHQRWELGDVLAHQTASGAYLIFHFVGRYQGDGIDGAPVVAQLDWHDDALPSTEAIRSGVLRPCEGRSPAAGLVSYMGFVLVHGDDDAVDPSALRRIGNFRPHYDAFLDAFESSVTPVFRDTRKSAQDRGLRLHASVPQAVRRIEKDRAISREAEQRAARDARKSDARA